MSDIVEKLKEACVGHPAASIPWPHRLLHNAADEITTLRRELAEAQSRIRALIDDGQKRTDDEVRYQDMLAEKDQELAEAREEVKILRQQYQSDRGTVKSAVLAAERAELRARALEDALAGVLRDLRDRSTTGFDGERVLQISQSVLTEAEKVIGPNLTLAQRRRDVVEAVEALQPEIEERVLDAAANVQEGGVWGEEDKKWNRLNGSLIALREAKEGE